MCAVGEGVENISDTSSSIFCDSILYILHIRAFRLLQLKTILQETRCLGPCYGIIVGNCFCFLKHQIFFVVKDLRGALIIIDKYSSKAHLTSSH